MGSNLVRDLLLTMFHLKPVSWWKVLDVAIVVVAVFMVLYQLINTQYMLLEPLKHSNMHLFLALVITFLAVLRNTRKRWPLMLLLALLGIASTGYVGLFFDDLKMRSLFNTPLRISGSNRTLKSAVSNGLLSHGTGSAITELLDMSHNGY